MNLKQLSDVLGLSQTTVSRALNGYPEVKEETRRRVAEAAERHNYRPNTRARSLATGRARAIGHVIPVVSKHEMVNPIFSDFIAGAGETYSASGYDMVLSIVRDEDEERAYRDMKSKGSVDGIVLHGPRVNDPRIEMLLDIGLPFVSHGRASGVQLEYAWLDVNNRRAFQRATEFLLDLGHRQIGLINGFEDMDFAARRRQGYEVALAERDLTPSPHLMSSAEMTEGNGFRAAQTMLAGDNPATAFLVSSFIGALGVRRAIEDAGLQMGRDVSVITHDDALSYLRNGEDVPIFTATRSSVRDAGARLAEMLIRQIENPGGPPEHVLLEAELMLGLSTGPVKG